MPPLMPTQPNDPPHSRSVGAYLQFLDRLESGKMATAHGGSAQAPKSDINDELARRERIKNDDAEQDIRLKKKTLNRLFLFLSVETALIFIFAFLQAVHKPWRFTLEDWSFKLLITATITQITAMLFVAVNYLFPKNHKD